MRKPTSLVNIGIARDYLFPAALFLKSKNYMKPRKLAKHLGISSNRAARVLIVLGWEPLNQGIVKNPTYER